MKKYQIIIKDNETGEELLNQETNCIIGAINNEQRAKGINCVHCDSIKLATTADAAQRCVDICLGSNRTARVMAAILASQKTTELTDEEGREAIKRILNHKESEDSS